MGSQSLALKFEPSRTLDSRSENNNAQSKALDSPSRTNGWTWFLLLITVLLITGYLIFSGHFIITVPAKYLYKPGDNVGYYLGLTGGSMVLIMLLYSLRKRFKFMKNLSILPKWFRWHIIFGILGPAMVVFHSTFAIHSINAGVALICMLLVSGSGIFGRFFYTKVHNGLYGRELLLKKLNNDLTKTGSFTESIKSFAPGIEESLRQFRSRADVATDGFLFFLSIEIQSVVISRSLVKELHQAMYTCAQYSKGDHRQAMHDVDELFDEFATNIRTYVKAIRDAAQFRTYERIFSWWHIFHIPLVYMLVFSGIYHVIAVHMY